METNTRNKRKLSEHEEVCYLTGIPITRKNSILLGNERVYGPALLVFSTFFSTLELVPITTEHVEEAREKMKDAIDFPFLKYFQDELLLLESENVQKELVNAFSALNIQKFWFMYLERLEHKLMNHLKLDFETPLHYEILSLVYHGILTLHCYIPEEALSCLNVLCKRLNKEILGETFWTNNPILLTQCHVWAHDFYEDLFQDHSRSSKKNSIALCFSLAKSQHPMPEIPHLTESQVCDQQLAIRLARGEYSEQANSWEFEDEQNDLELAHQVLYQNQFQSQPSQSHEISNSIYFLENFQY